MKTCDLNMDPYRIRVQNWSGRKGGGIALVHKLHLNVKENIRGAKKTFGFASWKISGRKKVFNVLAIYHPQTQMEMVLMPLLMKLLSSSQTFWQNIQIP